jgi:hypothetical protein
MKCSLWRAREGVRHGPDLARLNIEHFRHRLDRETDETKRQMLVRLLAEEEAKLKALTKPSEKKQERE